MAVPAGEEAGAGAPLIRLSPTPLSESEEPVPEMAGYGTRGFYGGDLDDEKGRVSWLKEVTSACRRAPEMARYRSFLLENLEMDRCAILSGLTPEECQAAGLELHHHPLTLYDVAELVLGHMEANDERITTLAVANRVMAYHWRGMVGLVPLTLSLHELAHAGQLAIDIRSVYGNWQGLLEECRAGLTQHLADKLRAEIASWREEGREERNRRLLEVLPQRWSASPPTAALLLSPPAAEGGADGPA